MCFEIFAVIFVNSQMFSRSLNKFHIYSLNRTDIFALYLIIPLTNAFFFLSTLHYLAPLLFLCIFSTKSLQKYYGILLVYSIYLISTLDNSRSISLNPFCTHFSAAPPTCDLTICVTHIHIHSLTILRYLPSLNITNLCFVQLILSQLIDFRLHTLSLHIQPHIFQYSYPLIPILHLLSSDILLSLKVIFLLLKLSTFCSKISTNNFDLAKF